MIDLSISAVRALTKADVTGCRYQLYSSTILASYVYLTEITHSRLCLSTEKRGERVLQVQIG